MRTKLGLFSTARKEIKRELQSIYVGADADSVFKGLAVNLLDSLISREHSQQTEIVIKALRYFYVMPDNEFQRLVTPHEQIQQWIKNHPATLIKALVFILRQVAVDAWEKYPEKYIRAFLVFPDNDFNLAKMRQSGTFLDLYCVINAVATSWGIPIILREEPLCKKGVNLRLDFQCHRYNAITNPYNLLQIHGKHIYSHVSNTDYFNNLDSCDSISWERKSIVLEDNTTEVRAKISAERKRCQIDFHHYHAHLSAIAEEQQLDDEDLTEFFLISLKSFTQSPFRPAGTERGQEKLFDLLCPQLNTITTQISFDMQARMGKINAIAQRASIGRLTSIINDYMDYREKGLLCKTPLSIATY